jgi:hypothetical protein
MAAATPPGVARVKDYWTSDYRRAQELLDKEVAGRKAWSKA